MTDVRKSMGMGNSYRNTSINLLIFLHRNKYTD